MSLKGITFNKPQVCFSWFRHFMITLHILNLCSTLFFYALSGNKWNEMKWNASIIHECFMLTFYLGQLDENLLSSEPQRQDSWTKSDADVCIVGQDREDRHQVIGRAWASINKGKLLCPIHIWPAMGLRSPYPAPIPLSGRPLCGDRRRPVRFSYGWP